jgi:hypothetical protein
LAGFLLHTLVKAHDVSEGAWASLLSPCPTPSHRLEDPECRCILPCSLLPSCFRGPLSYIWEPSLLPQEGLSGSWCSLTYYTQALSGDTGKELGVKENSMSEAPWNSHLPSVWLVPLPTPLLRMSTHPFGSNLFPL